MTSRVSLVRKYHLTSILILAIAFIIHFICVFMGIENVLDRASFPFEEHTIRQIAGIYSPHIMNGIFALAAGAYIAFDYFKYLHSKKETDFYESLPITRSSRFISNFICGFSTYVIFLFITLSAELLVGNILGIDFNFLLPKVFWNFICMIGIYLVSWVTAVLAMVMTGHSLIAVLGYGVFSVYFPILLYNLIPTFSSIYFETYLNLPKFTNFNFWNLFSYMSPASLMYKVNSFYTNHWEVNNHIEPLVAVILFTVIVGYLAYYLFKKRASEAAGRAMAFEKANNIIRIFIVIPLTLYLAIFLKSMSSNNSDIWLLFGVLFAGFICHGLIQGIFESDIKAVFTKKKQLLLVYILCFVFISIFKFDLFKFDEFIPKADKVETINIKTNAISDNVHFEYSDGISGEYVKLALSAVDEIIHSENGMETRSIQFEYQLKNGITISRNYHFSLDNVPKSLDELATKEEFKDDYCLFYKKDLDEFSSLSYTSDHENYVPITGNDLKELVDVYMDEFTNMTISSSYNEPVLYRFYAYYDNDHVNEMAEISSVSPVYYTEEYQSVCYFDVYASFEKTIEILNRLGYKSFADDEKLEIISLEVYSYTDKNESKTITDPNILAELKKHAYQSDYNRFYNDEKLVYGWANVKSETHEFYCDLYFEKEMFEKIMK